jgi:serine/threonine protein kinase
MIERPRNMTRSADDVRTRTLGYVFPVTGSVPSPSFSDGRPARSDAPGKNDATGHTPFADTIHVVHPPLAPARAPSVSADTLAAYVRPTKAPESFDRTVQATPSNSILARAGSSTADGPLSGPPVSISPTSGSVRVTVLPRVEMVGAQARVVSESRLRYLADRKLGEGGLGEVLGAVDQDIGRRVAVKRLRPEVKSDASLIRFAEEIRTVGMLEHPNIVPIHDVGVDERGDHYFVMKYVDGETLETIIEKLAAGDASYGSRYTIERRVEIFMALLEAVAFAHARGIIHRDIKPANVMVGAYGEVVLMDWGVAKVRGASASAVETNDGAAILPRAAEGTPFETQIGSIVGTPFYMSPEQAAGQPADERSDIYSLSMLFREFLTLAHPLEHKQSLAEVLSAVTTETFPSILESKYAHAAPIPAELAHFVRHGLEKDPAKRYQNVGVMIDRLRARATGDIPIECPVTFVKAGTGKWTRFVDRHPYVTMMLLSLSALGLIGGVVMGVIFALHFHA